MSATPPPASQPPRPFELHRAPPAAGGNGRLVAGALALAAVGLLVVALVAGRGTSALMPGSLEATPGAGLGSLRFGQAGIADAERLLGKDHDDAVQRTDSQSFGPDGEGPKVLRAVAEMAYRARGVILSFSAEVDASFDAGSPAHQEMFARFRRLGRGVLSGVEVRRAGVATSRGLQVGDTLEAMLEKHGPPARRLAGRRETRYLYPEGLVVEVETDAKGTAVTTLAVSPPIDASTLHRSWRPYEPAAATGTASDGEAGGR